jgi:anti-sigma factor RsiW
MSDVEKPVTVEELHAYADAQLSAGDTARVETWLRDHPEDAAKVREWQAQARAIQGLFAPYQRSLPDDAELLMAAPAPSTRSWTRPSALIAASLCLFAAGVATGHYLPGERPPQVSVQAASLHEEASSAFLIYTSEVRHPVEVRADEKDHLVTWLGKRLGHKLAAPNLTGLGFNLVGGRLVPVNGKAGALLMYEDTTGKRLTIMVGQSSEDAVTSFRFAANGPVETFYWIDDKLSYAVTGEIPRDMLRRVADACYQQFDT